MSELSLQQLEALKRRFSQRSDKHSERILAKLDAKIEEAKKGKPAPLPSPGVPVKPATPRMGGTKR